MYSKEAKDTLIALARMQKRLFDSVFDFTTHTLKPREPRRRSLFKRRPDAYEQMYRETEELRSKASILAGPAGGRGWWQVPWQEVQRLLYAALYEEKRSEGWRFEASLKGFDEGSGIRCVVLADEGASQQFTGDSFYHSETVSPYTEQERADRMKRYDRATVNAYLYQQMRADAENACIRSSLTDKVYNDVLDYYVSEGWILQSAYRKNYEEDMLTDKIVEGARATAVSRKSVKGLYAVGRYRYDEAGRLTGFQSQNFEPISVYPEAYRDILSQRHVPGLAVYKLCEYIASDNDVMSVPFSIISDIAGPDADNNMFYVQSAIFTQLSDKLTDA